jgi:hypothetical protein
LNGTFFHADVADWKRVNGLGGLTCEFAGVFEGVLAKKVGNCHFGTLGSEGTAFVIRRIVANLPIAKCVTEGTARLSSSANIAGRPKCRHVFIDRV